MKQHRVSNLGKESMFYIFFEALFHLGTAKKTPKRYSFASLFEARKCKVKWRTCPT